MEPPRLRPLGIDHLDNRYRDQAVTNAAQLADLLSRADVPVVSPSG
jgi:uncharacterized protein (DUF2235 family)